MRDEIESLLHREGLELAPIRKRVVATFIDETLLSIVLMLAFYNTFASATTIEEVIAITNSFLLEFLALKFIYQAFFVMQYGGTIGKLMMKIRIVEIESLANPTVLSSLNRSVVRLISEMFMYLGFIWAMMDPDRQGWHDKTAKTLVIDA